MCGSQEANNAGLAQSNAPIGEIEEECRQIDPRDVRPRAGLVQHQGSAELAIPEYEVLLIASFAAETGTGEMTAALNVMPFLPSDTYVIYGAEADGGSEAGRTQMLQMVDRAALAHPVWAWNKAMHGKTFRFRPRHWPIRPGVKPLLVIAPHSYKRRGLTIAVGAPIPEGTVLVTWGPLGIGNGDMYDNAGVRIGAVPAGGNLGQPPTLDPLRERMGPFYSVVPNPPQFNPGAAATDDEQFVVEAYTLSQLGNNRLACLYGHGTNATPVTVLFNLLKAAIAGTRPDRKVVIVVIHHQSDDTEEERRLSRPCDLAEAIRLLSQKRPDANWTPPEDWHDSPTMRTRESATLNIKIFDMLNLSKRCMDWLFINADLPIVEGANTVMQLISAGRPFLRAARDNNTNFFLGGVTRDIVASESVRHEGALADLRIASHYLSNLNDVTIIGPAVLRALLFNYAERDPLDAFATHVARTHFGGASNPLALIRPFTDDLVRPALGLDPAGLTFPGHEADLPAQP